MKRLTEPLETLVILRIIINAPSGIGLINAGDC